MAEGAGRGGTPARRGGVRGIQGSHPGPLAAVARPLAAERHPDLCARSSATPGHRGRLRVRYLGFAAIQKRLAQAIGHMKGPTSQSGSRRGQTQSTLLRLGMPWLGHPRVRAPKAVVGQGSLRDTSPPRRSWRAMYSGPGEPSGATWRPRGRPPGPPDGADAHIARERKTPAGEKG